MTTNRVPLAGMAAVRKYLRRNRITSGRPSWPSAPGETANPTTRRLRRLARPRPFARHSRCWFNQDPDQRSSVVVTGGDDERLSSSASPGETRGAELLAQELDRTIVVSGHEIS
jgi:hypothetical protein